METNIWVNNSAQHRRVNIYTASTSHSSKAFPPQIQVYLWFYEATLYSLQFPHKFVQWPDRKINKWIVSCNFLQDSSWDPKPRCPCSVSHIHWTMETPKQTRTDENRKLVTARNRVQLFRFITINHPDVTAHIDTRKQCTGLQNSGFPNEKRITQETMPELCTSSLLLTTDGMATRYADTELRCGRMNTKRGARECKQRNKRTDRAMGGAAAHRVLDLVLDDVERILRGGHPLMAVPERRGPGQSLGRGGPEVAPADSVGKRWIERRSRQHWWSACSVWWHGQRARRRTGDPRWADVGLGVGPVKWEADRLCLRAISAWFAVTGLVLRKLSECVS